MPDRKSGPRIDFWLSSQSFLPSGGNISASTQSDPQVSRSEQDSLQFIINNWLTERLRSVDSFQGQEGAPQEKSSQVSQDGPFTLCGVEQRICDLVTKWAEVDEKKMNRLSNCEVEWSGSFVSYIREASKGELNEMFLSDLKREKGEELELIEGRWKLESIEENDLDLVQSTNKLTFDRRSEVKKLETLWVGLTIMTIWLWRLSTPHKSIAESYLLLILQSKGNESGLF